MTFASELAVASGRGGEFLDPVLDYLEANGVASIDDMDSVNIDNLNEGTKPNEVRPAWLRRFISGVSKSRDVELAVTLASRVRIGPSPHSSTFDVSSLFQGRLGISGGDGGSCKRHSLRAGR